jgi:hypothetical protein
MVSIHENQRGVVVIPKFTHKERMVLYGLSDYNYMDRKQEN